MGPDQANVSAAMAPSPATPAPTGYEPDLLLRLARNLVGAGLASDGAQPDNCADGNDAIAGKPVPTGS